MKPATELGNRLGLDSAYVRGSALGALSAAPGFARVMALHSHQLCSVCAVSLACPQAAQGLAVPQ